MYTLYIQTYIAVTSVISAGSTVSTEKMKSLIYIYMHIIHTYMFCRDLHDVCRFVCFHFFWEKKGVNTYKPLYKHTHISMMSAGS